MPANFITPTPDEPAVCLLKALPTKTDGIAESITSDIIYDLTDKRAF